VEVVPVQQRSVLIGAARLVSPVSGHVHLWPCRVVEIESDAVAAEVVVGRTCYPAAAQFHARKRMSTGGD
jgi:hypothetical protein